MCASGPATLLFLLILFLPRGRPTPLHSTPLEFPAAQCQLFLQLNNFIWAFRKLRFVRLLTQLGGASSDLDFGFATAPRQWIGKRATRRASRNTYA